MSWFTYSQLLDIIQVSFLLGCGFVKRSDHFNVKFVGYFLVATLVLPVTIVTFGRVL